MSPRSIALQRYIAEARLALMFLTRLPVGTIAEPVPAMASATWAFPLAGLVVGTIAALVMVIFVWLGVPSPLGAGLALATTMLVTGAMHEDGLADIADGFGGGATREQKLAIMRDSRLGSYGALALVMMTGMRWSAINALIAIDVAKAAAALIALGAASRAGLPAMLALMRPARADGLGYAASGMDSAAALNEANRRRATISAIIAVVACVLLLGAWQTFMLAIAFVFIHSFMMSMAQRHIGGQTGDVLGASQQIAEITGWIVLISMQSGG